MSYFRCVGHHELLLWKQLDRVRAGAELPSLSRRPPGPGGVSLGAEVGRLNLFLEPAFLLNAPPSPLEASGPYRLAGEDAAGAGLFSLSFGMPEVEGDGYEGGGAFAFVLPVRRDWHRKLARVTISGPEGVAELDRDGDRFSALLVDRVTGRVRGYLKDWPAPGASGVRPTPAACYRNRDWTS